VRTLSLRHTARRVAGKVKRFLNGERARSDRDAPPTPDADGARQPARITDEQRLAYERAKGVPLDGRLPTVMLRRARSGARLGRRLEAARRDGLASSLPAFAPIIEDFIEDGVFVVPEYFSADQCDAMVAEVDRLIEEYPAAVQVASAGSDARIFGVENGSPLLREFSEDPTLQRMCELWLGARSDCFFTMANRIEAAPGNLGSGAGWHRDSLTNQFKTIVYLTDVDRATGPYQYIRGSQRTEALVRDARAAGVPTTGNKLSNDQVERLVAEDPGRLLTFDAPRGSVIIADTTGIHRGAPLERGVRYALTNYYYPRQRRYEVMTQRFKPFLGVQVPVLDG